MVTTLLFPRSKVGHSCHQMTSVGGGPYGHASFLRPSKGGHRTPFVALLINTALEATAEYCDYSSGIFCLRAYYGDTHSCAVCNPTRF